MTFMTECMMGVKQCIGQINNSKGKHGLKMNREWFSDGKYVFKVELINKRMIEFTYDGMYSCKVTFMSEYLMRPKQYIDIMAVKK
jgi:hypothetical protein